MTLNVVAASVRLPRITVVNVLSELKLDAVNASKLMYLYDCYGVVTSTKRGYDGKGPWIRFEGKFSAVTPDGIEFHSKRCHLPEPAQTSLCDQWEVSTARDPDIQMQIAVRVKLVMSGMLIRYDSEDLMPPQPFNELQAVRESVARYRSPPGTSDYLKVAK